MIPVPEFGSHIKECGEICDPVTLAVVGTAVAVAGQGYGALQTASLQRYQAKVADQNAKLEAEAAHEAHKSTIDQARDQQRRIGQAQGAQIAAQAANGVDVNFGSARQVQQDTEMLGREDIDRIYREGYQKVRGFDINAANMQAKARAARANAKGALIAGAFNVASTVLGGAQQYQGMKGSSGGGFGTSGGYDWSGF